MAIPPAATPSPVDKALNELRRLKPDQLAEVAKKLTKKEPLVQIPRTPAGGLAEAVPIDDILERAAELNAEEWADRMVKSTRSAARYPFSKIGTCFRRAWYEAKKVMPDDGLPLDDPKSAYRFDPGNSEPGHAVENHLRVLREQVYSDGKPGTVLKDVRVSEPLEVEYAGSDGKLVKETIYVAGKSDDIVVGDNLEVLEFNELKSAVFWTRKKTDFINRYGKNAPLHLIQIEEPKAPSGLVNVNNALQLAVGVHILAKSGRPPRKAVLTYINRERFREHINVYFSPAEIEFLHDLATWWVIEHHVNLQRDTPPEPQFFMGYECNRCSHSQRCKADGGQRTIHPCMVDLNARLAATNRAPDLTAPEPTPPAGASHGRFPLHNVAGVHERRAPASGGNMEAA